MKKAQFKKVTLVMILFLGIILATKPQPVQATVADFGTWGSNVKWADDGNGTITITGLGAMKDCPIAEIRDGVPVYRIPWYSPDKVKKVVISEGITEIGEYNFKWCDNLKEVVLPSTLKIIRAHAFDACAKLTKIDASRTQLTTIEEEAFIACPNLKTVKLPDSVSQIGRATFSGTPITTIKIPKNLKVINSSVFASCRRLKAVDVPASVTKIGKGAFSGCKKLASIKIRNKNCRIYAAKLQPTVPKSTTIYGYRGSTAQKYAKKYGNKFRLLSNTNKPSTTGGNGTQVSKLKIKNAPLFLKAGKSRTLKAEITPNTVRRQVIWKTSNKKYATVSKSGKVTAKKAGRGKLVKITATLKDGSKSAKVRIAVY